jgi:parallel beta-helix repeat protein
MDSNNMTGNTCILNSLRGIALQNCDFTTLTLNTIANTTTEYGLFITGLSDNNNFSWNAFQYNALQNGVDNGLGNVFDYNYWSNYGGVDGDEDGIGDTVYTSNAITDPNPLMYFPFPPEWARTPVDQAIEHGSSSQFSVTLEFTITTTTAPYQLSVDDTENFTVDSGGTIVRRWNARLYVGVYPLRVVATNIYGFITVGDFTLTVADTRPPHVDRYREGDGGDDDLQWLQWRLADLSPLTYILFRNGTEVASSTTPQLRHWVFTTLEDLPSGVYNYTIVAIDIWDNMASETVIVTIQHIQPQDTILPWLVISVLAVVVIIASFIVFKNR